MMMGQVVGTGKDKLSRMQPVPWLLCMTLALGIVMGSVYLVGRNGKTPQTVRARPVLEPLVIPTVEASTTPSAPPKPAPAQPAPALPAPAPPPILPAGILTDQDAKGLLFLQVGAVDATVGREFAQKVTSQGFNVRLAAGPDPKLLRILVGPLTAAQAGETSGRLRAAGYSSFPRQY